MSKTKTSRPGLTLMELVVVMMILVALAGILVPMMGGVTSNAQVTTTNVTMTALRNAVLQYYQDMKGIPLPRPLPGIPFTTDSTGMPQTLKDLQVAPALVDALGNPVAFKPVTQRGWRGPYLQQATGTFLSTSTAPSPGTSLDASFYPTGNLYGLVGDPAFLDGWGNPIVLQWPSVGSSGLLDPNQDLAQRVQDVRLVSAGPLSPNLSGNMANVIDTPLTDPSSLFTAALPSKASRKNDIVLFILIQDPTP